MRRLPFILPMALAAIIVLMFALGLDREGGSAFRPSAMVGRAAPSVKLPGLEPGGAGFSLDDHAGEVVVVNFFASWCVPCRAEHPLLMRLQGVPGLSLVGIAYKDKPADALAFLSELGDPFAAKGSDLEGKAAIGFGITGVPETFVLDRDGIIRHHVAGPLTERVLDGEIAATLAELMR
jgi:cytochrome c biogenesis protein CcmG/thiol:disulfide interchange protein DsbE